jgi:Lipocalin-like domain
MKKNLFGILALTTIISFASCKKSEEATCPLSAATIVGTYKVSTIKVNGVDVTSAIIDACQRDDTYTFNVNGSYVTTDAGVVCSPNNNDSSTWSLAGNTLIFDGDTATLSDFSCNGFTVTVINGTQTQVGTFVRQ